MIVRSQHKINKRDMNHVNVDLNSLTEMINRQVKDSMVKELLPHVNVSETDNGDEVVYESIVHVINHEDIRLMRSLIKEISEGGTMARFDLIQLLRTF
jgi:hypothetical protein